MGQQDTIHGETASLSMGSCHLARAGVVKVVNDSFGVHGLFVLRLKPCSTGSICHDCETNLMENSVQSELSRPRRCELWVGWLFGRAVWSGCGRPHRPAALLERLCYSGMNALSKNQRHDPRQTSAVYVGIEGKEAYMSNERPIDPFSRDIPTRDDVQLPTNRCPFCHDEIVIEAVDWVSCHRCQARHHDACWSESGACGSCGEKRMLAPTPRAVLSQRDDSSQAKSPWRRG
jgi:hypothetical protein